MLTPFLLGCLVSTSLAAALFFLRFWAETREFLFLAFGIFFVVEALARASRLFVEHPNEANALTYVLRLCASLLILVAIFKKNYDRK